MPEVGAWRTLAGEGVEVLGPFAFWIDSARREAVRTTRTLAAIRTLRRSSSFTLCISRSMAPDGLATNSIAPSSRARRVLAAPSRDSELTITIGFGFVVIISAVA